MFCKWCGATIPTGAPKCTRCGKEIPALSDCGGFYDLVPGAAVKGTAAPSAQPAAPKQHAPRPAPSKPAPSAPGKKNNIGLISLVVACVGVLLMLVLVLNMKGQIDTCLTKLEENNKKIAALTSQVEQLKAEHTEDPVEEAIPEEPKLEEQPVQIRIDAAQGKDGGSVTPEADLGEVEKEVTSQVTFDEDTQSLTGLSVDVGDAKGCIVARFKYVVGSSQDPEEVVLSVAMDVDSETFAVNQGQPEYSWSYRGDDAQEWTMLPADVFTCETAEEGATVTFRAGDVDELLGESAQNLELRLTYTRRTEQGGSLTLVVTGITIPRKDLKIEPVESVAFNPII